MKSNKNQIKIEVKVGEVRFPLTIPFSQQDHVRRIESELKIYLRELKSNFPNKEPITYLAMAAYHFASYSFSLKGRYEEESDEAERLLRDLSKLCGDDMDQDVDLPSEEFDIF